MFEIIVLSVSVPMVFLILIFTYAILYQGHLRRKADKGKLTKDEWKVYRGPSFF